MTRLEMRYILSLGSIFACRMLGLFMVLPVFSLYAQQLPGATPLLIGLALGGYGLTQALFQLPFGLCSDFLGRKKVIAIGLIIFAIGSLVAGVAHSIEGIIVGRALQGVGAVGSTIIAFAADLSQPKDRPKAMGIIGATIGASFTAALILGPVLTRWFTVADLFLLTASLSLLSLLVLWRTLPNHHAITPTARLTRVRLTGLMQHTALWRLNGSILLSHAILTALFVVLPLQMQHQLVAHQQWQLYLPVFLIALVVIGGLMRRLRHTHQQQRYFRWCVALMALSLLGFCYPMPHVWLLGGFLCAFFISFTLLEALLPSMVSSMAPEDLRGTAIGLYSSCQFLGIFCGGLLGGWLLEHYQIHGVFIGLFSLSIVWLVISWPKFELK